MSKKPTAPAQMAASTPVATPAVEAKTPLPTPAPVETTLPVAAKKPVAKSAVKPVAAKAAPAKALAGKAVAGKDTPVTVKVKAAVTPAPKEPATPKVAKPAKVVKENKAKKVAPKKAKLVRDSFTFPANDYALIGDLKQRALSAGRDVKKSELLRAGLTALTALSENDLLKALDAVERIKTGRPAK